MRIKTVHFTASLAWLMNGVNHGHAECDINAKLHQGHVEVEKDGHDGLNLEVERKDCSEEKGCRIVRGEKKVEGIPISAAQAQVQQDAKGDAVQEHSQRQSLTRLESKRPRDLHWLPYWATSDSADSFTQQVVLQWIWPQVLFNDLSNSVRLWKAVV